MRRIASALLALSALPVLASPTAAEFARRQPIVLGAGPAALHRLDLPADVYRFSARRDVSDLQVFNAAGEAVPWAISPAHGQPRPARDYPLPAFPLPSLAKANRSAGIVLDSRGLPASNRAYLALELEQSAYRGRVALSASDDGERWQPLESRELLQLSGSALRLDLHGDGSRYLRLDWLDKPFKLRRASLHVGPGAAEPLLQSGDWIAAKPGAAGEYLFDLGMRAPLRRLELALPNPNTSARGVWYKRERPDQPWQNAFSSELTQLGQASTLLLENLDGDSDRYWRLVVDTRQGGLGAGLPRLRASWPRQQLTFAARGQPPFMLAYGHPSFFITDQANTLLNSPEPAQPAALGPALAGGVRPAPPAQAPMPKKSPWLWGSLLLAVGLLGWISYRLIKEPAPSDTQ
ncbi:hypothetical protein DK842_05505 [Chromobacterium phragmitis]|uniref:DUF3999 domain-containing protein n=1 Tax=Chromobacterium phragmitis TaxID=2202141 RepID=A0A344UHN1_9NEIS|nr:DUF3999 family protein [Chromobacterium phragmitis]AXE29405.1 hypothetical protein DK842_05505 [Chromobacterium phragmitis]AXE34779.1 hypothetical protein DK843_11035 [Chromobacterium phragmitis]